MLTPTAPLVAPGSESTGGCKSSGDFNRRHGVLFLSILEVLGSISAIAVYVYALAYEPSWAPKLVPIPDTLCSEVNFVHASMYVFALFFVVELFLAIYLFDGARKENMDSVRFWLYCTLNTLVLVSIVVVGMELGGIRSPMMNSVAFVNIFLRFLEIMIVYAWVEQESMKRLTRYHRSGSLTNETCCNRNRRCGGGGRLTSNSRAVSTATITTLLEEPEPEPNTPPPTYVETMSVHSLQATIGPTTVFPALIHPPPQAPSSRAPSPRPFLEAHPEAPTTDLSTEAHLDEVKTEQLN